MPEHLVDWEVAVVELPPWGCKLVGGRSLDSSCLKNLATFIQGRRISCRYQPPPHYPTHQYPGPSPRLPKPLLSPSLSIPSINLILLIILALSSRRSLSLILVILQISTHAYRISRVGLNSLDTRYISKTTRTTPHSKDTNKQNKKIRPA